MEIPKTKKEHRNLEDVLGALGIELVEGIDYLLLLRTRLIDSVHAKHVHGLARKVRTSIMDLSGTDPDFTFGAVSDISEDPPDNITPCKQIP